jgi:hypothetical protein
LKSRRAYLAAVMVFLAIGSGGPLAQSGAQSPRDRSLPDPENGSVAGGIYINPYFGLSYRLPVGWTEGLKGPPPSNSGYYVLASLDGEGEGRPSLLIVAQDEFFGVKSSASLGDIAKDERDAEAKVPNVTIDREPSTVMLAHRPFMRLDYSGGGLYRAWLATDIRCHVVIFNITATEHNAVADVVRGLDAMSLPGETRSGALPLCIKDYARSPNVIHQVAPSPTGPNFLKLPVRIIIGGDGRVEHVHVIRAFPEQRRALEEALMQWQFKPYDAGGRVVEVETGLVFEFKPAGSR